MDDELTRARQSLRRATEATRWFARMLGGLNARGRFSVTIVDQKYWFAKLYQLMTYYEIGSANTFSHPRFVLHFIEHFFNLYYNPLQQYVNGNRSAAPEHWRRHFEGRTQSGRNPTSVSEWIADLQFSVVTGITAHIQGDMVTALVNAYNSWTPPEGSTKPAFSALRSDFMGEHGLAIFDRAKAAFFLDVAHHSPFPWRVEFQQYVFGVGEQLGAGGLDINEVFRWRTQQWARAEARLTGS